MKLPFDYAQGRPFGREPLRLRSGLYAYLRGDGQERCRVHLRVEPDGSSLLLVNANFAYHLNPTASLLAWLYLEGRTQDEATRALESSYRVRREAARGDVARLWADIDLLTATDGACPIHDADLEVVPPFSQPTSAPLRMDLALTYRCNDDCAHCYNARPRSFPEMPTEAWEQVLHKVRDIGVPHVCFTGGEATLRGDLPELTAHASSLGLITGLLTNGRRLSDGGYVEKLAGP